MAKDLAVSILDHTTVSGTNFATSPFMRSDSSASKPGANQVALSSKNIAGPCMKTSLKASDRNLFGEERRSSRRSKQADPLVGFIKQVDFRALADKADTSLPRPSCAKGGCPPYHIPPPLMTRILILQQRYNLADDAIEYQLLDRRSFLQFLGITQSSTLPDATTIWLFRDRLAQAGPGTKLSDRVQQQLLAHGYLARFGQIINASLVQASVQRNKRKEVETEKVKESTMPVTWKAHTRAQKDVDAKCTEKHGKNHFGYKLHASIEKRHKLVRKVNITNVAVSDSVVLKNYSVQTDVALGWEVAGFGGQSW